MTTTYTTRRSILNFCRELVKEHATEGRDGYSLNVKDLPIAEKNILLSYVVDSIEFYEELIQNSVRLQCAYDEYKEEMQELIDEVIDDIYSDHAYDVKLEAGYKPSYHADNGERYWVKR